MHGNAARLLLLILAVLSTALLGLAIWTSGGTASTQPSGTLSSPTVPTVAAVPVTTTTAHGSSDGYDATVQITQTGAGAGALTGLEIALTTEATPASAPTAEAQLTGTDNVARDVPLTLIGAGRWNSQPLTIAPGRYTLTTRFDRQGHPLTIPLSISVR